MKARIFIFMFLLVFVGSGTIAQFVNQNKAYQIAEVIYHQTQQNAAKAKISPFVEVVTDRNGQVAYYIFKYGIDDGFVVLAADERVYPVLAYSPDGMWDDDHPSPAHQAWMDVYLAQIEDVRQNNIPATSEITKQWSMHTSTVQPVIKENKTIVGPYTNFIIWDQNCTYNDSCPVDVAGPCGHVYVGCVATTMGILMKYHHHPNSGTGSYSYFHTIYGTQSANFGNTDYGFAQMLDFTGNAHIARLLYHAGVSVDMNYSPIGSSAISQLAVNSLVTFFNYNSAAIYDHKYNYTDPVWESMLKTELDNERPLLYRGQGTGGHCFVCDGYDDNYGGSGLNYFHFNWGWSGAFNGYYHLSLLNPGAHDFTNDQAAGFNIEPRTDVVPHSDFNADANTVCIGNSVSFFDMSSYAPNAWSWTFSGGSPGTSTVENPSVTYNTPGLYDVSLTASNVTGTGSAETKTGFLRVCNTPVSATCYPSTQTLGNYWYGVINVSLSNLNHTTGDALYDGGCLDLICHQSADLSPGATYNLDITVRVGSSGNAHTYVYMDFNNDGDFDDSGETIVNNQISSVATSYNSFTTSVTMPSSPVTGSMLRMRVATDYLALSGPCSNPSIGQTEDYGIFFVSPPAAPVATAASNITQTAFDANWNASSGATAYYLDVATDAGFTSYVSGYQNLDVGNVTTYNVTGLSALNDYYYRLRAYNANGTSGNSNVISLTTLPNAPSAPVATAASGITQTDFDANWNSVSGADGYYLDVATDATFTSYVSGYQNLDVGNVTTYNVSGLSAETDYYYRIRAYNTGGTSGNSNVISVTTLPNAPAAPVATAATGIQQTFFTANWNPSAGATGYYLDVATDNAFTSMVSGYDNLDVGNVTSHNVSGLTAETDYYYRIRAYNTGGTSGNSNVITLTTLPFDPNAPLALSATNVQETSFDANWEAVTGAITYYLDVATDIAFTSFVTGFDNLNTGNVTTYSVTGLTGATDYYYRLRSENSGGTSSNSNIILVTTLPGVPPPPLAQPASMIQQYSFDANWDASAGADAYYLDVATDNGFGSMVTGYDNLDVGNVNAYTVSGVNPNTIYYYRLRAYNLGGVSGNSNIINVTTLPVGLNEHDGIQVQIISLQGKIIISTTGFKNVVGELRVFTLNGTMMLHRKLENADKNIIYPDIRNQICVVQAIINGKKYTERVFVRGF